MKLFKHLLFLCVIFATFATAELGASAGVQVKLEIPKPLKVLLDKFYNYQLDPYQNVCIEIKHTSLADVPNLEAVIAGMSQLFKNQALYITFPIKDGAFSECIEPLGFNLCESDPKTKTLTYIYLNGRNIPELNYAYTAASVCLLRTSANGEKEVLIINEPSKTIANIIGGISNKGEYPEDTVIREVKEEVGVTIDKKNLKFLAISHTVRADQKICVAYYYVCEEFEGTPKADGVEVSECAWVPLSYLLQEEAKVFGKPVYPLYQKLLSGELRSEEGGIQLKNMKVYQHFSEIKNKGLQGGLTQK